MIGDFVDIGLDPWRWRPAPLINQVVLIGAAEEAGAFDLAPKTSAFFASTVLPAVGFACNTTHHTACNIFRTGAFVVNVPDVSQAAKIWDVSSFAPHERLAAAGWHARAGDVVAGACWDEAAAQLECTHHFYLQPRLFTGLGEVTGPARSD